MGVVASAFRLSPTVDRAIVGLRREGAVAAADIANAIMETHPEFGGGLAATYRLTTTGGFLRDLRDDLDSRTIAKFDSLPASREPGPWNDSRILDGWHDDPSNDDSLARRPFAWIIARWLRHVR